MMDRARRSHEIAQRTRKIILQRVGVRREKPQVTPPRNSEYVPVSKIIPYNPNREGE